MPIVPVATIMKVFSRYSGNQGLRVPAQLGSLDLSASRNDTTVFIHVANCNVGSAESATIKIPGAPNGRVPCRASQRTSENITRFGWSKGPRRSAGRWKTAISPP